MKKFVLFITLFVVLFAPASAIGEAIFPNITAINSMGNVTGVSIAQKDVNYTIFLPWMEWNDTSDRPQILQKSNIIVANFGGDLFTGPPSKVELLSYEYALNITNINVTVSRIGMPVSVLIAPNGTTINTAQSLGPVANFTVQEYDLETNTTINMVVTAICPNLVNEACPITNSLLRIFHANNTNTAFSPFSPSADSSVFLDFNYTTAEFTLNVTNRSSTEEWRAFRLELGLYNRSMTFETEQQGPPSWLTSPVFIDSQTSVGFDPTDPPEPGDSTLTSTVATLVNKLGNYTTNELFTRFFVPTTIDFNETGTYTQVNVTNTSTVSLLWLNCTSGVYQEIWNPLSRGSAAVANATGRLSFVDNFEDSPSKGATINVTYVDVNVNLTAIDCLGVGGSRNGWSGSDNVTFMFNFTFAIPQFAFENTTGFLNATIYTTVDEQAVEFTNDSLPGWYDANLDSLNVTVNGDLVYACGSASAGNSTLNPNDMCYETGSVNIKGLETGANSISISYGSKATSTGTTTGSSTGGSTGGGGVGLLTAGQKALWYKLYANVQTEFKVTKENNPVTNIQFTLSEDVKQVGLAVNKLDSQPALITQTHSGKAHSYLEITPQNINVNNLKAAAITFKVEKTWLQENNADKSSISLLRWAELTWQKLDTKLVSEDDNFVYYSTSTPGFSIFAIVAESVAASEAPLSVQEAAAQGEILPEQLLSISQVVTITQRQAGVLALVIVVLIATALYYGKYGKRRRRY